MSALFETLQRTLETVYRVQGPVRADAFQLSASQIDAVMGAGASHARREALVVTHEGEYTDVGLYVQADILMAAQNFLDRSSEARPRSRVRSAMDAFCVALEGVSHFLYFTFCGATLQRPVSRIELELQAEVDKFVLLRSLGRFDALIDTLFSNVTIDERLAAEEQHRYRVANQEARRYARWVDRAFRRGRGSEALQDARRLYRMPLTSKLEHIARAA